MLTTFNWNPWTELAGLHRDLDSLFGRYFGETPQPIGGSFTPSAEVSRDGDRWQVAIAMPGVSPDRIGVEVVGRRLRVRGEIPPRQRTTDADGSLSGRFEREFTLPEDIDVEKVQAVYRYGILELTLPITEGAKPRRIAVSAPEAKQLKAA